MKFVTTILSSATGAFTDATAAWWGREDCLLHRDRRDRLQGGFRWPFLLVIFSCALESVRHNSLNVRLESDLAFFNTSLKKYWQSFMKHSLKLSDSFQFLDNVQSTSLTHRVEPFRNRPTVCGISKVRTIRKVHPVPQIVRMGILTISAGHHSLLMPARRLVHVIGSTIATALPTNKRTRFVVPSRPQRLKMSQGAISVIVQVDEQEIFTMHRDQTPSAQAAELRNRSTSRPKCPFRSEMESKNWTRLGAAMMGATTASSLQSWASVQSKR